MLGEIELHHILPNEELDPLHYLDSLDGQECEAGGEVYGNKLDWVIIGGESGAKRKARPMDWVWADKVYKACQSAEVPFFFKQWGTHGFHPDETPRFAFESCKDFPYDADSYRK